jgi:hypothetical protein
MLWANSSKTFMGDFYRKPLVSFHANHFSMPTISVIVATTSQNFMVFQKSWSPFSIFGSALRQFVRVNHPKLLHLKRNPFKTTSSRLPCLIFYQK